MTCTLAALATRAVFWLLPGFALGFPFHAWVECLPALLYGVAIGQTLRVAEAGRRGALLVFITVVAWVAGSVQK